MNLLHMKYALVVAEKKSINKAAEELYVGAPALSRAIKELEHNLGVTLFKRSAKGMVLTPEGKLFVDNAKLAMEHIDDIENLFKEGTPTKESFSISVPRASYIASAFVEFSKKLDTAKEVELCYKETNALDVINNVSKDDTNLGILRFKYEYEDFFETFLKEKGLASELITEFKYVLLVRKDSPLTKLKEVTMDDLIGLTEISYADAYIPTLSGNKGKNDQVELARHTGRQILLVERAMQFELLANNPNIYMWVSSIPQVLKDRYGLVELECVDDDRKHKDILIRKTNYKLTPMDNKFVEELIKIKRELFN